MSGLYFLSALSGCILLNSYAQANAPDILSIEHPGYYEYHKLNDSINIKKCSFLKFHYKKGAIGQCLEPDIWKGANCGPLEEFPGNEYDMCITDNEQESFNVIFKLAANGAGFSVEDFHKLCNHGPHFERLTPLGFMLKLR